MGLPSADRDLGRLTPQVNTVTRSAATYVTDRLGDECRDVLEALGLIGYVGHDQTRAGSGGRRRVWREGAIR